VLRRDLCCGEIRTKGGGVDVMLDGQVKDILMEGSQSMRTHTKITCSMGDAQIIIPLFWIPRPLQEIKLFLDIVPESHAHWTSLILFVSRNNSRHCLSFDMRRGTVDDMFLHFRKLRSKRFEARVVLDELSERDLTSRTVMFAVSLDRMRPGHHPETWLVLAGRLTICSANSKRSISGSRRMQARLSRAKAELSWYDLSMADRAEVVEEPDEEDPFEVSELFEATEAL